jgi:hypothetical protein
VVSGARRDPPVHPWQTWDRAHTYATKAITGVGTVATWHEITNVSSYEFESDGTVLASDSTLRFRDRRTVEESLNDAGFRVAEVRDAPDRPGRELVFTAIRPADHDQSRLHLVDGGPGGVDASGGGGPAEDAGFGLLERPAGGLLAPVVSPAGRAEVAFASAPGGVSDRVVEVVVAGLRAAAGGGADIRCSLVVK